jgi:hypothetical protein
VRVHFHDDGNSLMGDPLCRVRPKSTPLKFPAIALRRERLELHASVWGFVHPFSGKSLFSNPLLLGFHWRWHNCVGVWRIGTLCETETKVGF